MRSSDQSHDAIDLVALFGVEIYKQFLDGKDIRRVSRQTMLGEVSSLLAGGTILSYRQLQDEPDYRGYIQGLFSHVPVGEVLVIVVPHAFLYNRQLTLPSSANPRQRRLYTPGSLFSEVEEALAPNDYRVRWAGDLDRSVDDAEDPVDPAVATGDVGLILERIVPPAWQVVSDPADAPAPATAPDFEFEPRHTRIETTARVVAKRILGMLDHQ